jgi:DNA-binding LacI/PurR family transcriptional regulator
MPAHDVGIEDVATAAGVATSTVSRALRGQRGVSEANRERIRQIAAELGYVPTSAASKLATGRTRTIGVLAPTVNRWFFSSVVEGIDEILLAASFDLMLFSLGGHGSQRQSVFDRTLRGRKVDGLIVLGFPLSPAEEGRLAEAGVPVVTVGHGIPGVPSVSIDEYAVVAAGVSHLAELGHTDIAFLSGGLEFEMAFIVPRMREDAFRREMRRRGLPIREEWVGRSAFTVESAHSAGVTLAQTWDETGWPTAILASSDEMAFGLVSAFAQAGKRVPEDISVVGIDNHSFSESFGLSSVGQDAVEQGRTAARLTLAALSRPQKSPAAQPHTVYARRSSAAPRHLTPPV